MPKILVAIPCYKCAPQIQRVLSEFTPELASAVGEVAVFDNRSPDETLQAALTAAKEMNSKLGQDKFKVFLNDDNYGLGGTHKAAFLYGERNGFDYVAILHGDNQAVTEELGTLIEVARKSPELDAVLGARFMPGSRLVGYNRIRTLGNLGLNWLYTLLTLRKTYDLGSGLNLFKLQTLKDHRFLRFSDKFTYNMDHLLDYFRKRSKIKYVPISWREEDQVSGANALKVGWITLKTLFKWRFLPFGNPPEPKYLYTSTLIKNQ